MILADMMALRGSSLGNDADGRTEQYDPTESQLDRLIHINASISSLSDRELPAART
jgi:hypothetical protein